MTSIWIGMVAGFFATAALSVLMLMKQSMKFMPQMDMIAMIAGMMKVSRPMGWVIHFMVGTVLYGGIFGWILAPSLSGTSYWILGIVLGGLGWLFAMVAMMPMAGKGFFGMKIGIMAPMMSLLMHIFFGAVLGWVYGLIAA
jgi:hypothetical protein